MAANQTFIIFAIWNNCVYLQSQLIYMVTKINYNRYAFTVMS